MKINGLPVVDAKKKMQIVISKKDVNKGKTKDPGHCAAALACLREVKGCTEARVHVARTYLKIKKKWVRYHTPESLRAEIVSFDRGGGFDAGVYTMTPMQPSHRGNTGRKGGKNKPSGGRDKKRMAYHVLHGVRHFGAVR